MHPSLVVVAGTLNNAHGSSRFSDGSTVTYAVQQTAIDDRERERHRDLDGDASGNLISATLPHHKPGILRLHQQQNTTDFTVRIKYLVIA